MLNNTSACKKCHGSVVNKFVCREKWLISKNEGEKPIKSQKKLESKLVIFVACAEDMTVLLDNTGSPGLSFELNVAVAVLIKTDLPHVL